jgi:hypothetical protein
MRTALFTFLIIPLIISNSFEKASDNSTYLIYNQMQLGECLINNISVNNATDLKYKITDTIKNFNCALINSNKTNNILLDDKISNRTFSTYLSGNDYDQSECVKADSTGNSFVVGYTYSTDFPTTIGAYSQELNQQGILYPDIFVSKFDTSGSKLTFSTYIGDILEDYGKSLCLDKQDNIFITGYTKPTSNFPTTAGAFDSIPLGGYDIFVMKLNQNGSNLLYSTLLGGDSDDFAISIVTDSTDNVIITGYTSSDSTFPSTVKTFQKKSGGNIDAFVSKINRDGTGLIFSGFLGGSQDDFAQDVVIDKNQYIYLTGFTRSADFPVTQFAYKKVFNDTNKDARQRSDAFYAKISPDGQYLIYSTYLGGKGYDGGYGIAVDRQNCVYLTGMTESRDFPVTKNTFDSVYNSKSGSYGAGDAFVAKFDEFGKGLVFSTFIGGEDTDRGTDISIDSSNNVYIVGCTNSGNFPVSKGSLNSNRNNKTSSSDGFVIKLAPDGKKVLYSSYIGGSGNDVAKSIAVYDSVNVFITGSTISTDFPITKGAFQNKLKDTISSHGFLSRLSLEIFSAEAGNDVTICKHDSVRIGEQLHAGFGNITISWYPKKGLNNPNIAEPIASPDTTRMYYETAIDERGDSTIDSVKVFVNPKPYADFYGPKYVIPNVSYTYYTYNNNYPYYNWTINGGTFIPGIGTSAVVVKWGNIPNGKISLSVRNDFGCTDSTNGINAIIGSIFKPVIVPLKFTIACDGDSVILDAGEGYQAYLWSDGKSSRCDTVTTTGSYYVTVTDMGNNVGISDPVLVQFFPHPPKPAVIYQDKVLHCTINEFKYCWYIDDIPVDNSDTINLVPNRSGTYKVEITNVNGCASLSDGIYVVVADVADDNVYNDQTPEIYPNPGDGKLNIKYGNKSNVPVNVIIRDVLGKTVDNFVLNSSNEIMVIEIGYIPAGVYFFYFYEQENVKVVKYIRE